MSVWCSRFLPGHEYISGVPAQGCQRVVEDWQRILQVRSLVLEPAEHQRTWLKYASLCRKSNRLQLAHKALVTILGVDPSANLEVSLPTNIPQVKCCTENFEFFALCLFLD